MTSEQQSDEQDWADNPRLNAWLAKQEAAFPEWVKQTGQEWDFTPESLDRLEDLVRRMFSTWEEAKAAEDDPILSVAAWYLGEVQNRHYGTVWQCRPYPPQGPLQDNTPFVIVPEEPRDEYDERDEDEEELYRDEDYRPACDPADEIRALFVRGPENRLRDVLTRYS